MISQTVEYALRAVVFLADQREPRTTQQIAERTKVPAPYLAKVMQSLNRADLVHSQRGLHGGFTLAKSPERLTIWDVVQAVEPFKRIRSCPLELESHRTKLCPLHKRLDDALAMIERAFKDTTVAEILAEPTTSKPLCPFPHALAQIH
jgi:Rrf2 family protein